MKIQKQLLTRDDRTCLWHVMRIALIVFLFDCFTPNHTSAAQPDEYTLKVAYLYNFTRYIAWPAKAWREDDQKFIIGVVGENPFGRTLDQLARKKRAQNRKIEVKYFKTLADCKRCHILFVSSATSSEIREAILRQTRNQPVLVIGENVGYSHQGATVNFVLMTDGTIKIEINIDAMNRREMQVNALLLKLATVVRDQTAE